MSSSQYRTHTCGQLTRDHVGTEVKLSGWIYRRRDHGGVVFIDLRDHFGVTQIVFHPDNAGAEMIERVTHMSLESVIQIDGKAIARDDSQVNPKMATGEIEVDVAAMTVLNEAKDMPYNISDDSIPEEMRLKYRFLDLRTERVHSTMKLRNDVMRHVRETMWAKGFDEFQTPILTASSPEGARDFLVASRLHPGKFYALPQAPQQFKQLLMCSGFDKYFQIAPCFRDEDARADRSPTEFYQLDMELSFTDEEEVFAINEEVVGGIFSKFANWGGEQERSVDGTPWRRIPFDEAMLKYASDKPDLRVPLEIRDVSDVFANSDFGVFKNMVAAGGAVRAIPAPGATEKPRSWFDGIGSWAQKELGAPAAPGYISWTVEGDFKGPLAKFLSQEQLEDIFKRCELKRGDVVFFVASKDNSLFKIAAPLRVRIGQDLGLAEENSFKFCWITDFPMFEENEDLPNGIDFSHNPFSAPVGGLDALQNQDPLTIKARQYDLVCNGYELLSGAIRNAEPKVLSTAFEMVGYDRAQIEEDFKGMLTAFKLGAPPHGGSALGLERVIMLLADTNIIRDVVIFPMTQRGEDLMMGAPNTANKQQLRELYLTHKNLPEEKQQQAPAEAAA